MKEIEIDINNDTKVLKYVNIYFPYYRYGNVNPDFDDCSSRVLRFKEGNEAALNYYFKALDSEIPYGAVIICPESSSIGISKFCEKLAGVKNRKFISNAITQKNHIPKKTRDEEEKYQSYTISNSLKGYNEVYLIDDVYTTGSTLKACYRKLKEFGVSKIHLYTIAKTFKYY